jgi:hypothetical protein
MSQGHHGSDTASFLPSPGPPFPFICKNKRKGRACYFIHVLMESTWRMCHTAMNSLALSFPSLSTSPFVKTPACSLRNFSTCRRVEEKLSKKIRCIMPSDFLKIELHVMWQRRECPCNKSRHAFLHAFSDDSALERAIRAFSLCCSTCFIFYLFVYLCELLLELFRAHLCVAVRTASPAHGQHSHHGYG